MRRLVLAGLACAAVATPSSAALPNADAGVVNGSGQYYGTADPGWRDVSFTGSVTLVGTDGVMVTRQCSFYGRVFYTLAAEAGTVAGTCGPFTLALCAYAREGLAVELACIPDSAHVGAITGAGVYTLTDARPTTLFNLTLILVGFSDVKPVGI